MITLLIEQDSFLNKMIFPYVIKAISEVFHFAGLLKLPHNNINRFQHENKSLCKKNHFFTETETKNIFRAVDTGSRRKKEILL